MMTKSNRTILAFGVAPFVPSALYWIYVALQSPRTFRHAHLHPHLFWEAIDIVFWTSVVVTFPIMLAIGIPAYRLIEKHSTLRRQHVLGISGAVGAAVGLLAAAPVGGTLLGLSAGITFWLIRHRERDETRLF